MLHWYMGSLAVAELNGMRLHYGDLIGLGEAFTTKVGSKWRMLFKAYEAP